MQKINGQDIRSFRRFSDCWSAFEDTTPARPALLLSMFSRFYEGIWRAVEKPWSIIPKDLEGPLTKHHPTPAAVSRNTIAFDACALIALGTWRTSKGIYVFDKDFAPALEDSSLSNIPTSLFLRLPERAVYIPMEIAEIQMHGFFAVRMGPDNASHLAIVPDGKTPAAFPMPCFQNMQVEKVEGYLRIMAEMEDCEPGSTAALELILPHLRKMLMRLLYLCAEKPDISGEAVLSKTVKTKRGPKLILPETINRWDVGLRLGAVFRKYQEAIDGEHCESGTLRSRSRPHLRRAHWHTYLTGEGRTVPRVHWVHPAMINTNDPDELVATVRPVEDDHDNE